MDDWLQDPTQLDDADYERLSRERDVKRLEAEHSKTGFVDGIDEGRAVTMQKGFNQGFKEASGISFTIAALDSFLKNLQVQPMAQDHRDSINSLISQISKIRGDVHQFYEYEKYNEPAENQCCGNSSCCNKQESHPSALALLTDSKTILDNLQLECQKLVAVIFGSQISLVPISNPFLKD